MAGELPAREEVPDAVEDRGREALESGVRVRGLARAGITTGSSTGSTSTSGGRCALQLWKHHAPAPACGRQKRRRRGGPAPGGRERSSGPRRIHAPYGSIGAVRATRDDRRTRGGSGGRVVVDTKHHTSERRRGVEPAWVVTNDAQTMKRLDAKDTSRVHRRARFDGSRFDDVVFQPS